MVKGLDKFKEYFAGFSDNYVIIGGTACDIHMENAAFYPRATRDIDVILVVEALNTDFVSLFWKFIQDGQYKRQEKNADKRKYYRFLEPIDTAFPYQIELFSRTPDNIKLQEPAHLTPIPADDEHSSLSAILLNEEYYRYMLDHSFVEQEVRLANLESLICLKAKAYLDIKQRISEGGEGDARHLRKHKNDIFKLAVMLPTASIFRLPDDIKADLTIFLETIKEELPDKTIYKNMGFAALDSKAVFEQLKKTFLE